MPRMHTFIQFARHRSTRYTKRIINELCGEEVLAGGHQATGAAADDNKAHAFRQGFCQVAIHSLARVEHLSHGATETIRKALSQALVHYYPFTGRISSEPDDGGDEFSIRCSGEGSEFVAASVGCSLKESKIFDDSPAGAKTLLDELAVFYPAGSYGSGDPLLSVQAMEFSCGGLVLGATWNHAVADGTRIAQFLAAAGELARGSPSPSVAPSRWDEAVSALPPWLDPILEATLMHPAESPDMELLVPLGVTVPSALISRVKAESRGSDNGRPPCTTFETVLAVLWRCRVRATMSEDPEAPAHLTFAANMRRHVGAREGYYGNCVADQPVAATGGAVASVAVANLVGMIRRAKDRLPDKLIKESESGGGGGGRKMLRGLRRRYDMMHVTCWRNIGFEQVDFGGVAPPARVLYHERGGAVPPVPTCVVYLPCRGKDGVNVLTLAVKEEHVDAFLGELAKAAHVI